MTLRWVVPWPSRRLRDRARAPRVLTILTARGHRLAKLVTPAGIEGYDKNAKWFRTDAVRIDVIEDLAELLLSLAGRTDTCVIRGQLKQEFAHYPEVRRLLRPKPDSPATFAETPRSWCMADMELASAPRWVDPTDPLEAGGYLRRLLPVQFRIARAISQLSSGAGLKAGLRCHMWFALNRPLTGEELVRLLEGVDGLDHAPFVANQIHYTADPQFTDGVDDPCIERLAILPGLPVVEVGQVPEPVVRQALVPAGVTVASSYRPPARGLSFRSTRPEQYMMACLHGLAQAREGDRHKALMPIACRLFELCRAGQLDPQATIVRIIRVALGTGLERDEIDSALAWAWQQVEPRGLP
jgi:hypothetical protein